MISLDMMAFPEGIAVQLKGLQVLNEY